MSIKVLYARTGSPVTTPNSGDVNGTFSAFESKLQDLEMTLVAEGLRVKFYNKYKARKVELLIPLANLAVLELETAQGKKNDSENNTKSAEAITAE